MEIKRNIPNKLQLNWKKKWTLYCTSASNHSTTNLIYVSAFNKVSPSIADPYFHCCVDRSLSWLCITFLLRIWESWKTSLSLGAPYILNTLQNLRSRRDIKHMFTQLNSRVELYPSFSPLFTWMEINHQDTKSTAETSHSIKKQQTSTFFSLLRGDFFFETTQNILIVITRF